MKTKNLLPNRWKPLGWLLLLLCAAPGIWILIDDSEFPIQAEVTIPWPFQKEKAQSDNIIEFNSSEDGTLRLQLIDELLSLGVIAGLMLAGFSRLKNKDERTAQMRLEALQWALYGNTAVLVLCIVFIHGFEFIDVMIYNMFTPLLIFVIRFHWLIWRETRDMKRQEGGEIAV